MRVAGVDFSSHAVDIVTVPYDTVGVPVWTRFPLIGADAFDRARSVADAVPGPGSSMWDEILAVGIEHPAGHHGVGPLLRIQGSILARIPARMLVQPWPPSKWRKATGLAGNASKAEAAHVSLWNLINTIPGYLEKASEIDWPQDAHDAHLIALATRQAITTEKAA